LYGPLAQLVEQIPFKDWVVGSNPTGLTILPMQKTSIINLETGISKKADILRKTDFLLEVVLEGTTVKIILKKEKNQYVGKFKEMVFISSGK
jgi:hypothetical protein